MRIELSFLLAFAVSGANCDAIGQTKPPAQTAHVSSVDQARQHFQRGVQFFREASFDAALAEFSRAYELASNYRILYNLGQVQVERRDYAAALKLFRGYLDQGGSEIPAERRTQVENDLDELANRVARISIDANVSGAEVLIDEVAVGTVPLAAPVLVNAGVRSVVVRKAGYASESRQMTMVGGETSRLEVRMAREPDAGLRVEALPTKKVNRTPMWIGLSATAVLGGAAATFAVLAKGADSDLGTQLDRYPADQDRIRRDRSREKTFALLADGFGAGALLALGLSAYAALATGASPQEQAPPARAHLYLPIVPTGSGLQMTGHF
jgi:hypothetical protein